MELLLFNLSQHFSSPQPLLSNSAIATQLTVSCNKRRDIVKNTIVYRETYTEIYYALHQHPEHPCQEDQTATVVREHLEENAWRVEYGIGGHGVIGVLHNGPEATVLLRSELDALPITEKTNLPYASEVEEIDTDGIKKGVMHACAHDMHMACLLGAADLLERSSEKWSGTLIALFQPNAEQLLERDNCGQARRVLGYLDSLNVRVYGHGANEATTQLAVDPILLAANIITKLQIVARETDPKEPVVIRCSEFHGGTDASINPEYTDLKVDVRCFSERTQKFALDVVKLLIEQECLVSGSPTAACIVTTVSCPATENDEEATGQFMQTLKEYYGDRASKVVQEMSPDITVADDFPLLAQSLLDEKPIPYIY
ncbi:uncharacterized protein N7483_004972 [Penicillium malachiteum]|uniref:uncharacterized protein n=1 Tax=Penicillium malachiteum TaxID=1324776 RepID=UPI0025497A08|nr:uncharacterized protein N7483_004972 [Penicillium malachiteum]KAJ5730464.1 hypothetical protein N7483_004972 [Penicillium malachiteum]